MCKRHENQKLNSSFLGFQGVAPEEAKFLFINSDAIFPSQIIPEVFDYLIKPIEFINKNFPKHHPLLLYPQKCEGKNFHINFASLRLDRKDLAKVCFIELLDYPTEEGCPTLEDVMKCRDHLKRIDRVIKRGTLECVFIPDRVASLMRKSGEFDWMPPTPSNHPTKSFLKKWTTIGRTEVICNYHFSATYSNAQRDHLKKQLPQIREIIMNKDL